MKNSIYRLLLLAAPMFFACNAEDSISPELDEGVVFGASMSSTKVTYEDDGDAIRLSWDKGDEIGIFSDGQSNVKYRTAAGGVTSALSPASKRAPVKWLPETESQSFYAVYPYSEDVQVESPASYPVSVPSVQKQVGMSELGHIEGLDLMWAAAKDCKKEDGAVSFGFHHAFSVIDIELACDKKVVIDNILVEAAGDSPLAFTGGAIDLGSGDLSLDGASKSNKIELQCGFTVSWKGSSHFYLVINPHIGGETIKISAVSKGVKTELVTKTVPETGLPVGKTVYVKADYEVPSAAEVKIKDLSELGTANTYIVPKSASSYKIKATTRGNGVIPAGISASVDTKDISPKSVLVLWYSPLQSSEKWSDACPIDLNSLMLDEGYVYFDTPAEFVPGNVVVAAFAEEGLTYKNIQVNDDRTFANATMLWSWNLWVAENYDPEESPMDFGSCKVMNRNLGAVIDGRDVSGDYLPAYAAGNFYQWGRKDPFPGFDSYKQTLLSAPAFTPVEALQLSGQGSDGNLNKQMFGYGLTAAGALDRNEVRSIIHRAQFAATGDGMDIYLGFATKNPHLFIPGEVDEYKYKTWCPIKDNQYKSLWGDPDKGEGRTVVKSMYDPCPVGWRVLGHEVVDAFGAIQNQFNDIDGRVASNLKGVIFKNSYIPVTGTGRDSNTMSVGGLSKSYYEGGNRYVVVQWWNASACDVYPYDSNKNQPGKLMISANELTDGFGAQVRKDWANTNCAQALPVRCVKE